VLGRPMIDRLTRHTAGTGRAGDLSWLGFASEGTND
jgi:hypothetical protein